MASAFGIMLATLVKSELRITWEAVEKPPNSSLFEATRLNSLKLGVKFFNRLMDYMHARNDDLCSVLLA